jgi:hypothetical protein
LAIKDSGAACSVAVVKNALLADAADFLMVGDVNYPGHMDSPCLLHMASYPPTAKIIGAVRLISTDHDQTSIFELLGRGSARPGLADWTTTTIPRSAADPMVQVPNGTGDVGGTAFRAPSADGRATFDWSWRQAEPVTQLSIGSITSTAPIRAATVSIELPDRTWNTISRVEGTVGDEGITPYVLTQLAAGTRALGLRVRVDTSGTAEVAYVNAIGPVETPAAGSSRITAG